MVNRRSSCGAFAMALLSGLSIIPLTADEWAFDFGTPDSRTRPGFTKVGKNHAFGPDEGFGFESTDGMTAIDRSKAYWCEKKRPPASKYHSRACSAYRATSYSTCDFVEGRKDNAFLLKAPDGEYEVWTVVADPAYAPPFFEIRANGETKHRVRLGRRGFVFMEPFRARAEGGTLRIELAGAHGWLLNALVVGTPGEMLSQIVSEMERDIFFDYAQYLKDWEPIAQRPQHPRRELSPEDKARGYVVFARDYTTKVYPFTNPDRREIGRPLTAFATPGEFEPATAAIYPVRDLGGVEVEVSDFTSVGGDRISRESVEVGIVRYWRQRKGRGSGSSGSYAIEPELIEAPRGRMQLVKAGETKQWWFTLRVPEDAGAGRYRAQVTFRPGAAPPTTVEWRLMVLPFKLVKPGDRHWGTWLDQFPPLRGLRGREHRGRNTPAERERLARQEIEDFRDHGFDVAILPASYVIKVNENAGGDFSYDIRGLLEQMEYLKILGRQAVVPITFEYLCRRLEYRYAEPNHKPGDFSPKARRAIVGLVQYLEAERKKNDWPQFLYMPIDEPGNNKTPNRMTFGRNVLEMVQSVPGAQTGCTITASGVRQLGARINTRVYAYGHVSCETARRDARRGFPYWYYRNGMLYGSSTVLSRNYTGFQFLRSGAQCATGWGFAAYHHNPYNDFDGTHQDWCVLLPGADGPIPTIYWELCREGIDDCRYVATLQELIAQTGKDAARARAVLQPLLDPEAAPITQPAAFHRYRWQLAREILRLSGRRDLTPTLSFTPVVSASAMKETPEENVIENPSFEKAPQADGLPGWPYPFEDAYSKTTGKPAGAISVTDEIAHDGKHSLKWDFAKSEGKGAKYGSRRYLIINVQVAKGLVPHLRGRRVRTGMWVRLGGGTLAPGFSLRMFGTRDGKYGFLDNIAYKGGIEDMAVWNRYETEGVILPETDRIDIHLYAAIPEDPQVRNESVFYIDEVSLQPLTPVPVKIESPLDEVYAGEPMRWQISTFELAQRVTVSLLHRGAVLQQWALGTMDEQSKGVFPTDGLTPGQYRLRASAQTKEGAKPQVAWRDVVVAPDPFAW